MNEANIIGTKKTVVVDFFDLIGKGLYLCSLLSVTALMILINVSDVFPQDNPQAEERRKKIDDVLDAQSKSKKLIKKFVINGDTLVTPKDFDTVLNKYRDRELSSADLQKAADEISSLYRRRGYIVNLSYFAEQGASDDTVEFKIVGSGIEEAQAEKLIETKP
jgi:hemolysin activation/secretion protein